MHCHLDLYANYQEIIKRCDNEGIFVLSVTTTPKAWQGTEKIAKGCNRIRTALGFHPELAHLRKNELPLFEPLINKTRYIGEIGLDGSSHLKPYINDQLLVFRHILKLSHKNPGKILSIHSRASTKAVLNELKDIDAIPILHWFSGNKTELLEAIDMGCWFSVNPSMLSTKRGIEIVSLIPKNRILTETDGPFTQINGKELYPWDVDKAEKILSRLWSINQNEVKLFILENLKSLVKT